MEAAGVPDPGFGPDGQDVTGQDESMMPVPDDRPHVVFEYGTTAREQADGEPLSVRLERETPDVLDLLDVPPDESEGADTPFTERAGQGVGRLVAPDEGVREDVEKDMLGVDVGTDLGGYTMEEQAMHFEPGV